MYVILCCSVYAFYLWSYHFNYILMLSCLVGFIYLETQIPEYVYEYSSLDWGIFLYYFFNLKFTIGARVIGHLPCHQPSSILKV